jgi:endoglucanase
MATRYAGTNAVIGADLRNEPHAGATWGDGNTATDWRAAAQRAGDAVLAANPNLLIIVEGVQFYGSTPSAWWGENLMGVATAPVTLQFADGSPAGARLVYSAHDYGPDLCGSGCPWFNSTTTYASLVNTWNQYWGYIVADPTKPYAAPVWIGEFGTCNSQQTCVNASNPGSQGQWFSSFVRYLAERHLSWCYWSLNGTQSTSPPDQRVYGAIDWYGLLRRDWSGPVPWVHDALTGILSDSALGRTAQRAASGPPS